MFKVTHQQARAGERQARWLVDATDDQWLLDRVYVNADFENISATDAALTAAREFSEPVGKTVVVVDAATGTVVREGRAKHPSGTEVDPNAWWQALELALEMAGGLADFEHADHQRGKDAGMLEALGQVLAGLETGGLQRRQDDRRRHQDDRYRRKKEP